MTSQNGVITDTRQYFAYGSKRGGDELPFDANYTGQRLDDSGLLYYNARYYDPELGMFISPDTVIPDPTDFFSYNRYLYARGNPLKYNDPTGHAPKPVIPPMRLSRSVFPNWWIAVNCFFAAACHEQNGIVEVYADPLGIEVAAVAGPADDAMRAAFNTGKAAQRASTFLRHQPIPESQVARPSSKYQILITEKNYEEVWQLSTGRDVHLDAIDSGYVIEAKWVGANDNAFLNSPYHPDSAFYDASTIIDQASRQIQFAREQGLNGVKWVISAEGGQQHFADLLSSNFPQEVQSGFLQVWHAPGNGMK